MVTIVNEGIAVSKTTKESSYMNIKVINLVKLNYKKLKALQNII